MRTFISNDFQGYWPVGTAAVVLADDAEQAKILLKQTIKDHGLGDQDDFNVKEIISGAFIINDGDY